MGYIVFSLFIVILSLIYKNISLKVGNSRQIFLLVICLALSFFAGSRTIYNDTYWYRSFFLDMIHMESSQLLEDFNIGNVPLFRIWTFFIYNYISNNFHVYFFLSSLIFVVPFIFFIDKYSKNFVFSIFVFLTFDIYLFSLAAIKQCMAMGFMIIGISILINNKTQDIKKYICYYLCCLIAIGFHPYSIVYLFLPLLGTKSNKRTIIFYLIIIAIGLLGNVSSIGVFLSNLIGKELDEQLVASGSVSILRLLVFLVPVGLSLMISKRERVNLLRYDAFNLKLSNISTVSMSLALFASPILFGRLSYFFIIGMVAVYPTLIDNAIKDFKLRNAVYTSAIVLFLFFGVFTLYKYGAFTESDVFGMEFNWWG